MIRTLVIDDEAPARAALRGLLRAHPEIELVGEADTLADAEARLQVHDYDVVFLDIQLLGGTGFDLLPFVRAEAHVVFVTAYDQHAVRAFEVNALDYLVKPVSPERLDAALRRCTTQLTDSQAPSSSGSALAPTDRIHLKVGNGHTRFVALADIAAIEANENYSAALLADGNRLLVRRTMKQWEDTLPRTHFVRVHRGTIVNLLHFVGSQRESYETTLLQFSGLTEPVRASQPHLPELRARLVALGRQL